MKKAMIMTVFALVLILSLSVSAFAAESEGGETADESVTIAAETSNTSGDGASGDVLEQTPTVSEQLLRFAGEHISEIFCVLTFLSSAINMYLYKKGLMPSIGGAVSKINSNASAVFDRVAKYSENTDEMMSRLEESIAPILKGAQEYADKSSELAESLDRMDGDAKRMQALFGVQSELIYTLFMSASIPQYQKDAMAECYTKIKTLSSECES